MPVRRTSLLGLLSGWALLVGAWAQAQEATVYRCGNSYQARPCPGGVAVDAADPRSDALRREAEAARQREAVLARQVAADRRAAERDAARQGGPANVGPAPGARADKPRKPVKAGQPEAGKADKGKKPRKPKPGA